MIAKGLDFERVTLVGVVNADTGLLFPDFRADEQTFQLLAQVAGRAGRKDLPGEVYLQTRNPKRAAIRHATQHDYAGFAREALEERRLLGYPPFGRIASVAFRGPKQRRVRRLANDWTARLREHAGPVEVLGPEPAFVERVKKQHRYATTLRSRSGTPGVVQRAIRHAQEAYGRPPRGYHVAIDIDAQGLP
jgi:primosomal protein N' (replication factor Y)